MIFYHWIKHRLKHWWVICCWWLVGVANLNRCGRVIRLLGWLRGYSSSGSSSGKSCWTDQICGSVNLIIKFNIGGVASAPPDATNKTNRCNQNYGKQSRHKEQQNITAFYLVSSGNPPHNNQVYHHNGNEEDNPTNDKTNV